MIVDIENSILFIGYSASGFFLNIFFVLKIVASFEKLDFLTEIPQKMTWQNVVFSKLSILGEI